MSIKLFSKKSHEPAPPHAASGPAQPRRPLLKRILRRRDDAYDPAPPQKFPDRPLDRCEKLGRLGAILADVPRWKSEAGGAAAIARVLETVDERFGLVPEGFASIPETVHDTPGCPETDHATAAFLLARHPVTNADYQGFVDDDGYENLDLWPQDIWPHLIDMKDLAGVAAPRYWRDGRHDRRLADHPVVGICYYEAAAYAAWAGYRLPSEAEWQMAASWRIRSSAQTIRRYPWGDALDVRHCNIWSSGIGRTVAVGEYASGAAPNGVLQLIGNVWEWTDSDFIAADDDGRSIIGDMVLKSIRGGAFDTYFASQATSTFRTGLVGLARVHNVGVRCALDLDRIEHAGESP
ncbi:MAG: Hercynine oxygenase [Phycisphaerae bacterium]|nr:Hercynine oxygenase [Phycisphaerae bacterium]